VCAISAKEAQGNNRVLVISHHTSGQIVLKVRSQLRSAGYRVHIDPDMRSGTTTIHIAYCILILLHFGTTAH